jgi:hypothetical protein
MESIKKDSVVEEIVSKFQERSRVGIEKYGTTLDRKDLTSLDWINHLQEEMMDGILYAQRLRREDIVVIPRNELLELKTFLETITNTTTNTETENKIELFFKKYLE